MTNGRIEHDTTKQNTLLHPLDKIQVALPAPLHEDIKHYSVAGAGAVLQMHSGPVAKQLNCLILQLSGESGQHFLLQ